MKNTIFNKGKQTMRVVIAEDDVTSRKMLELMLSKVGMEVISTDNGKDALYHLTQKDAPKIAILDWMMPEMNGITVCEAIKTMHLKNPPYIILLTTMDKKEDIILGLQAGANDYVTKPFNTGELTARLDVGRRVVELQTTLNKRVQELQDALSHIATLQGIIPICMCCHKIRNDQESWQKIEHYIEAHSEAQFSHSVCPDCMTKYYSEALADNEQEEKI